MNLRKSISAIILLVFSFTAAHGGILVVRSNGVTMTGADGIWFVGINGVTMTGADGFLSYQSNGVTMTGADGVTMTGADGVTMTGADGVSYTGGNGVTMTGADGVTMTGADGVTMTGADGVTMTGADGTIYQADSIFITNPEGVTMTGADGLTLAGVDGVTMTGADGVTMTGADGVTMTGADGVTMTGADSITGLGLSGVVFQLIQPAGVTMTGADGVTMTGADGVNIIGAQGVTMTGADSTGNNDLSGGLYSLDPELAIFLNEATDDSTVNAVVVFHGLPLESDLEDLRQIGILGGTRFRVLPMVAVTATRQQIIAVSRLSNVRSIYGNRTLDLNSDPYFDRTAVQKVSSDDELRANNQGLPVSGRNVTVAVLDTGVNSLHNDLAGKVIQNVRLTDTQSASIGFAYPQPVENIVNTDPVSGHGTFVSGIISASGISSQGRYSGVAPGSRIVGLGAGDLTLSFVLAGFDYLLEHGSAYNARVLNCSFSSNSVFDLNDPVNVATKMLTQNGISVVFSAGNSGSGSGTLNPYAAAPWVVSVGATDHQGRLADFSSRGVLGSQNQLPSLVAPGVNLVSLRGGANQTGILGVAVGADVGRLTPGDLPFYTTASGTSFSAPQVAGAIALMLEANPQLQPAEIKNILQQTSTPMPGNFSNEVGAGMLNTHAAVLAAAFPERKIGIQRAKIGSDSIKFTHSVVRMFDQSVNPGSTGTESFAVPENTIHAGVHIAWGFGANDLGLKIYDEQNRLVGNSNQLNAAGLTGNREEVSLSFPTAQTYRADVRHTAGVGTWQRVYGAVELTQVEYVGLSDLAQMSPDWQNIIKESLRTFLVSPHGHKFKPDNKVRRAELADSIVRSGSVRQYVARLPLYTDVRDLGSRNVVESVQSNDTGKLFFDAAIGGRFHPHDDASRLITAVALVRAAGLDGQAATAILPPSVSDFNSIPVQYRGHVALAIQMGFMKLQDNRFDPGRSLTRAELSLGTVGLVRYINQ